ncbi:MAG: hypothetical protein HFI44_07020 [Lachnospiraceae bacterium]|jgi:hypothetical protein|nr:hypothetical protein [Lachnospiraceae bacterium]
MFFNGAQPCDKEKNCYIDKKHKIKLSVLQKDKNIFLSTNLYDYVPRFDNKLISTAVMGVVFESEQRFEAPDGSELILLEIV